MDANSTADGGRADTAAADAVAALQQRTRALAERVKELDCLYAISSLMLRDGLDLADVVRGTLAVIPAAWQYPADAAASIELEGIACSTPDFRDTAWCQAAVISLDGEAIGRVTVCYLAEKPASDEGPFLREERRLIDAIAELLAQAVRTHRARASLRASEAKYRSVVEQSQDGIVLLDGAGVVTEWNRGQERIYGLPRGEAVGRTLWQIEADMSPQPLLGAASEREWLAALSRLAAGEPPALPEPPSERRILRADGRERVLQSVLFPVRSGPTAQVGAITRDVTESRLLEEEARRQAALRTAVVEAAPLAILSLNAAAQVTTWNRGATFMFGWEPEEVIGRPNPTVPADRQQEAALLWEHLLAGGSLMEVETQRCTKEGHTVEVSYSAAPLRDSDGVVVGAVIVMADLTERKRVEDALRQAQQRQDALLRTAPMAVFRRLAAGHYDTIWASDAVEALTGYPASRFRQDGGFWLSRVYPGDRDGVLLEHARACRSGSATYQYRWRAADDSYRHFVERSTLIAAAGGGIAELLVTTVDAGGPKRRQVGPTLRGQVAPAASNWRRVLVQFPSAEPAPLARPPLCPHCGSQVLQRHQTATRRLAGGDGPVHVTRYRCTTCGRTFSNRPRGVDRRRQTAAVRALVALLAALGLSGEQVRSLLADAGMHLSRTTAWRIARQAREQGLGEPPAGTRCILPNEEAPPGSEYAILERIVPPDTADGDASLSLELLIWERSGGLYSWLRQAVETLGAALTGTA